MNREQLEGETVDTLRKFAAAEDVEGRSSMDKEQLVEALAFMVDDDPPAPVSQAVEVGIDPGLVAARDNLRKREQAEQAAVPERPPVTIDDVLVADRAKDIAAGDVTHTARYVP